MLRPSLRSLLPTRVFVLRLVPRYPLFCFGYLPYKPPSVLYSPRVRRIRCTTLSRTPPRAARHAARPRPRCAPPATSPFAWCRAIPLSPLSLVPCPCRLPVSTHWPMRTCAAHPAITKYPHAKTCKRLLSRRMPACAKSDVRPCQGHRLVRRGMPHARGLGVARPLRRLSRGAARAPLPRLSPAPPAWR